MDAQSPMAIVILTRGSDSSMKLRDGDISWHDFLETVKDFKCVLFSNFFFNFFNQYII